MAMPDATKQKNKFNDIEYWKNRHTTVDTLEASGLQSVGQKANDLIYKMLANQYKKILGSIDAENIKTVLDCGYGDGYFLKFFSDSYPKKSISGVDISPAAKKKIDFIKASDLHVGDLASFDLNRQFDLAHCFDVLYHILEEDNYIKSLENVAKHSGKYIALHERFFEKTPLISSTHVRMRRNEVTNQVLNSRGFFLRAEIPSHFIAMRMLTGKLNKIAPGLLYKIDNKIANDFPDHLRERLASHRIKIYQRAGT